MADSPPFSPIARLLKSTRPLFLLSTVLVYSLGVGIADYLGVTVDWGVYWLGQAWVTALQLGGIFLYEYYISLQEADNPGEEKAPGKKNPQATASQFTIAYLAGAATFFTVVASLSVLMLRELAPAPEAVVVMALACLGVIAYSLPPASLVHSGYGELLMAVLLANLTPAFAFLLQAGELHRLLAMTTFPLTALLLSRSLIYGLARYAADIRILRRTLLVRVGWQRGMALHNAMVVAAFLLIGLALALGLPLFIGLPPLILLPLGLVQIWQMRRIADGAKPNWRVLGVSASALFAITAYLFTFAFWTR